jgi:glyoxylase-like metal-dependent hydrolase (beta-lactamase superfamily II)/ferredoxin
MAQLERRLSHNAAGDFFVDATCIDCDTCRWMAPETFSREEHQSSVYRQPSSDEQTRRALMALVSCPTSSIGSTGGSTGGATKLDASVASEALPDLISDDVYHCGYHAESSFGAASYLIVREQGNVLIDSPRFAAPLVQRLEELGGVQTMFLTHRDDVADHAKFREHFQCERVLHEEEIRGGTRGIEHPVSGYEPVALADDLLVIPTPGHTQGSCCLLYRERFLFTGDHIAWSESRGHVYGFRSACWYDWDELVGSTEKLADHAFEWILPGHGRRCYFPRDVMATEMTKALEWMRGTKT